MTKKIKFLTAIALIISMLPMFSIIGFAAEKTTITVGSVTAEAGSSISVPVTLSSNTGICGATIKINYDENLTLTKIEKGTALSSLMVVLPKDLTDNPIEIPWAGADEDTSTGIMVTLTFTAPEGAGNYPISVSYLEDEIVDGDLNPVDLVVNQGGITVAGQNKYTAENMGVFYADEGYTGESTQATAFKATLTDINGKVSFTVTSQDGESQTFNSLTQFTNANVVFGIVVSGLADANAVGEITIEQ